MSTQYNFPAHRPEQTFLCSVNAGVRGVEPTPDPDRPHSIRIGFYGRTHFNYTTGYEEESYRGVIIFHSAYPIYAEQKDYGRGYKWFVAFYQEELRQARIELELTGNYTSTWTSNPFGAVDYNANAVDIALTGSYNNAPEIIHENGEITTRYCELLYPTPIISPSELTEVTFGSIRKYDHTASGYGITQSSTANIYAKLIKNGSEKSGWIQLGEYDEENTGGYEHFSSNLANFNNPLFASGDAWLDYCKSL